MNHDEYRELLALRLYGELDPGEDLRLEEHLEHCPECRALDAELATGLGALRGEDLSELEVDLPDGWSEALSAGLRAEPQQRAPALDRRTGWLFAAAGFAAGLLCAAALFAGEGKRDTPAPPALPAGDGQVAEAPRDAFHRDVPPPPARASRQLAQLAAIWGR